MASVCRRIAENLGTQDGQRFVKISQGTKVTPMICRFIRKIVVGAPSSASCAYLELRLDVSETRFRTDIGSGGTSISGTVPRKHRDKGLWNGDAGLVVVAALLRAICRSGNLREECGPSRWRS